MSEVHPSKKEFDAIERIFNDTGKSRLEVIGAWLKTAKLKNVGEQYSEEEIVQREIETRELLK